MSELRVQDVTKSTMNLAEMCSLMPSLVCDMDFWALGPLPAKA